jgi:hypothetical protein
MVSTSQVTPPPAHRSPSTDSHRAGGPPGLLGHRDIAQRRFQPCVVFFRAASSIFVTFAAVEERIATD